MNKINFQNNVTPASATTMNTLQDNIENAINSIVESGSNDYGNWIKYADGTMICTKTLNWTGDVITNWGSLYETTYIDLGQYAQEFIEKPIININQASQDGGWIETIYNTSKTNVGEVIVCRATQRQNVKYIFNIIAIGRWK